MASEIEAVIHVAGQPDARGIVVPESELRKLVDGKRMFWDGARRALVYRGPGVPGVPPAPFVMEENR